MTKQEKDAAFIEKISTITVGPKNVSEPVKCPKCGVEGKLVGAVIGEVDGKTIVGPVYTHAREQEAPKPVSDDALSFSA